MATTSYVNVRIPQGELRGKTDVDRKGGKYCSFYAIPYAKPPVGELRFKSPQPSGPWTGVRDALVENAGSYAHHSIRFNEIVGQEDCLYLNVYTKNLPDGKTKQLKPVMFWIHGGAYAYGSGSTELYAPTNIMTEDVVIVSINYRLGLLGFISFEDPSLNIPGNAGMRDMVMALKWVQKNIEHFNGDPNNVTISGESAGSASVHLLMFSPLAKGLFHRAILMSGVATNSWAMGAKCGTATTLAEKGLNWKTSDEKEIYKKFKDLPLDKIMEIQDKCMSTLSVSERWIFNPILESGLNSEPVFIKEKPTDLMRSGNYNKVPMMIGYTNQEGLFLDFYMKLLYGSIKLPSNFEECVPWTLGFDMGADQSKAVAAKIKQFYYGDMEPSLDNLETLYTLETDIVFAVDIIRSIREHVKTSGKSVYMYVFSADTEMNVYKKLGTVKTPGAGHADDLGYLFKCYLSADVVPGSIEDKSVERMIKLFTNFIKNGNPNPETANPLIGVKWNPCTDPNELKYLDLGNELVTGVHPKKETMALWDNIYAIQPNKFAF